MNWAIYVGVKSVHQVEIGHAPSLAVEEQNDWNLEQAVRETEKIVPTDQQQLMTETTYVSNLKKNSGTPGEILGECQTHRRKLSSRFGLIFLEDRILVQKNSRTTVISLLHKRYTAITKMTPAVRHFRWPKMAEAIQNCET